MSPVAVPIATTSAPDVRASARATATPTADDGFQEQALGRQPPVLGRDRLVVHRDRRASAAPQRVEPLPAGPLLMPAVPVRGVPQPDERGVALAQRDRRTGHRQGRRQPPRTAWIPGEVHAAEVRERRHRIDADALRGAGPAAVETLRGTGAAQTVQRA
ncbi:hypothetical protein OG229_04255 [Streptomyces platensis]|uniref:hypothetical protein n=1 Tax=Streptomyces platensis TaxID=58346 RepID=UPI002E164056|nr:hypothetical protein OG229_04255 [Streptomyces platensis]